MRRRTRWWWPAGAVGLAGLGAAMVLVAVQPWAGPAAPFAQPSPTPEPEPVAVLEAPAGQAPAPTADGVRAAIEDLVTDGRLGGSVSAAVVDLETGEQLYAREPDAAAVPASTTKVVTGAAVLASRGPAYQIETVAMAGAEPGEVVLVGGGDPALAAGEDGFYPGAASLVDLAEQVRETGQQVTKVTVDSSLFTGPVHGDWDSDVPGGGYVGPITALMTDGGRVDPESSEFGQAAQRWEEPDLAAGEAFAELLGVDSAVERGSAPAGAAELGRVVSPPILRLVEIMLVTSDNVLAEALARQVAVARDEPGSFEGAATAVTEVLDELGVAAGGTVLADGSGLSRSNRLTAALLTDLLVAAAAEPALAGLLPGLPVAGWSGTLADRFDNGDGVGSVRAKTGTLAGVNSLAGLVVTGDGRPLGFAVLADQVPGGEEDAERALDAIAAALAGCGCR
jgi:D-alanyl-D-alanine carboxypeptidase/D-alanyl-D-alanine-endopeptidase (penicillin-binding protein 4)